MNVPIITVNGSDYNVIDYHSEYLANSSNLLNLFENNENVLQGKLLSRTDGTTQTTRSDAFTTDYIPVIPGARYTDRDRVFYVLWYGSGYQYIGSSDSSSLQTNGYVTAPAGAYFVRFAGRLTSIGAYYVLLVEDMEKLNLFKKSTAIEGQYYNQSGTLVTNSKYFQTGLIGVEAGEWYTDNQRNCFVLWYSGGSNPTIISSTGSDDFARDGYVVAPANAQLARFMGLEKGIDGYRVWRRNKGAKTVEGSAVEQYNLATLTGKKWTAFGDSITYRNAWQPDIVELLALNYTNCGIGSTRLSGENVSEDLPSMWKDSRLDAVKASNPDIVTILGGANDITLATNTIGSADQLEYDPPLNAEDSANASAYDSGTSYVAGNYCIHDSKLMECTAATSGAYDSSKWKNVKNVNTFIGAYGYIIDKLLEWKHRLAIVILGTTWGKNDGADVAANGLTYTDYSEASKTVAAFYGLPFVDLHGKTGFNKYTMGSGEYAIYSADQIHPNATGAKRIAKLVLDCFVNELTAN